ncbi:MAG TPA: hypothetical protein VK601_08555, partial [Kofleriaceae bacterium]|nr:hypothetical protein [Kofleriaceae bacterium]
LERPEREAAVLALLGAAPAFSALPGALAGALRGACAAVVAAIALGAVVHVYRTPLAAIDLAPGATALSALVGLGGLGLLVGLVGGGLAGVARAR